MSGIVLKHQISGYGHRSFAVMEKQRKRFDSGGFSDQLSPAGVAACSDPEFELPVGGRKTLALFARLVDDGRFL